MKNKKSSIRTINQEFMNRNMILVFPSMINGIFVVKGDNSRNKTRMKELYFLFI